MGGGIRLFFRSEEERMIVKGGFNSTAKTKIDKFVTYSRIPILNDCLQVYVLLSLLQKGTFGNSLLSSSDIGTATHSAYYYSFRSLVRLFPLQNDGGPSLPFSSLSLLFLLPAACWTAGGGIPGRCTSLQRKPTRRGHRPVTPPSNRWKPLAPEQPIWSSRRVVPLVLPRCSPTTCDTASRTMAQGRGAKDLPDSSPPPPPPPPICSTKMDRCCPATSYSVSSPKKAVETNRLKGRQKEDEATENVSISVVKAFTKSITNSFSVRLGSPDELRKVDIKLERGRKGVDNVLRVAQEKKESNNNNNNNNRIQTNMNDEYQCAYTVHLAYMYIFTYLLISPFFVVVVVFNQEWSLEAVSRRPQT
eukprot:gene7008-4970_t